MRRLNEVRISLRLMNTVTETFISRIHANYKDIIDTTVKLIKFNESLFIRLGNILFCSHLLLKIIIGIRIVDTIYIPRYWPGVQSSSDGAYASRFIIGDGARHPDLGLMCRGKARAARPCGGTALPTALCAGTFTCAAALIDARLRINTPPGRLVRTRHVPRNFQNNSVYTYAHCDVRKNERKKQIARGTDNQTSEYRT